MGAEEGEVITHALVTRSIERAQKRVELNNFEARKRLLDYDDVMNQQREVIYDLRLFALEGGEDLKGETWEMIEHALRRDGRRVRARGRTPDDWDLAGLRSASLLDYFIVVDELPQENGARARVRRRRGCSRTRARAGARRVPPQARDVRGARRSGVMSFVVLSTIDDKWRDHLYDLDHLKASIGFRGWGQKDPLVEYKQEAYEMFVDLMADLRKTVAPLVVPRADRGAAAAAAAARGWS